MQSKSIITTARLATLNQLIETILPNFLTPVPSRDTLRIWFDAAKIPRFKSNPSAKRGGGTVFYSVPGVEKFLHSRTTIN
jgi:trehalose utilization protein